MEDRNDRARLTIRDVRRAVLAAGGTWVWCDLTPRLDGPGPCLEIVAYAPEGMVWEDSGEVTRSCVNQEIPGGWRGVPAARQEAYAYIIEAVSHGVEQEED